MSSPADVVDDGDHEQIVARVAAIDIGKQIGKVCTRVPHETKEGRRYTRVWDVPSTTGSINDLFGVLDGLQHRWLAPVPASGWGGLPASVTATTATSPDGRRVHIIHNWSWEPVRVAAPVDLADVLTRNPIRAGTDLALGAWDVRILFRPVREKA